MSHTKKDKPYWVRLNQEAKYTDHDHIRLGKPYSVRKYLYDEKGQPLYHDEPVYFRAKYIASFSLWYREFTSAQVKLAKELVGAGKGEERIQTGTRRVRSYEDVQHYYADHCTEGEPLSGNGWRYRQPCYPAWPWYDPSFWGGGYSKARKSYHDSYYGHKRRQGRNTLRNMTKAANSAEDGWEDDYEKVERLTDQHRHSTIWAMY